MLPRDFVRKIQEEETVKLSIKIRTVFIVALGLTFLGAAAQAGAPGRALKLLDASLTPAWQAPAATPGGPPPSLQEKMKRLQTLANQREQAGGDIEPIAEIAQGVGRLIDQKKYSEAEALVDRALKLLVESPAPAAAPPTAAAPPVAMPKKLSDKSDPHYLVYQFMADSDHPEQARPWVEKLQAEFGRQKPGQAKYLGFGFFIEDMNGDVSSVRRKIETLLEFAEQYEMPVWFQLEGTMFWSKRPDRLTANPEAVEWSAFPGPGQKTGPIMPRIWFNWGQQTALPVPPPCFASPIFQADVTDRLQNAILAPLREALKRWQSGPVDRTYLFAGITVGNEVQMQDYRDYKMHMERGAPRPQDKATGLEMTDAEMVRGGYCSLYNRGYTAEKVAEIVKTRFGNDANQQNTDTVITDLLNDAVHDYMAFRAKILWDGLAGSGAAQKRIYTHTTAAVRKYFESRAPITAEGIPTVAAGVNPYSRPGFTVVRERLDLPDLVAEMQAAGRGTTAFADGAWGAVESYATVSQPGRAQTHEEYAAYLDMLYSSGAKLVSLLEAPQEAKNPFTIAAESVGVKTAIKEWLQK